MEAIAEISAYERQRNKPMPSKNHSIVQGNLYFLIRQLFGNKYKVLIGSSLNISPKDKVPDLAIYKNLEFKPGLDEVKVKEIPLGVIEIESPSQNIFDLISNSHKYFDAGVKSYWLVLSDVLTIYVYKAPGDFEVFSKKEILKDEQLDIELDLGEVFK